MAADLVVIGAIRPDRRRALEQSLSGRGWRLLEAEPLAANASAPRADLDVSAIIQVGYPSSRSLRMIADSVGRRPELGVVVLGPVEPGIDVLIAVSSGVSGYLPYESQPGVVADAIEVVARGEVVLPISVSRSLVQLLRSGGRGVTVRRPDDVSVDLTSREWQVLVLLRQGRTTAEIASRLVVANVTVRSHVLVLLRKLGLAGRSDLAIPFGRAPQLVPTPYSATG
jgi:DNA-binding NarL/FixJ family response regulator